VAARGEDGSEIGTVGDVSCNSGMNEKRDDGMMGGKTGGRSDVDLGTSGRMVEGTGLGDGIERNVSPDVL